MANTVGGPFGGLLNNPDLWERLLNSFGSIGRFLSQPPGPSIGENALRDVGQIGVTAPLGVPGAIGLSAFGEGMRPPWEQSPLRVPERGLETASDLSKLALRDPMMLQKLATSALLGAPSAFSQAFHEHPVLTPLMAIPILPGGRRFGRDDIGWSNEMIARMKKMTPEALNAFLDAAQKHGMLTPEENRLGSQPLENALQRIAARERRIKRKLTQHEVEDVIQQALSERAGNAPPPNLRDKQSAIMYKDFSDADLVSRLRDPFEGFEWSKADNVKYEIQRRARSAPPSQSAQGPTREELLHQFEEGPPGPLPPQARLERRPSWQPPTNEQHFADMGMPQLAESHTGHVADVKAVLDKGGLPSEIYAKTILSLREEARKRGSPLAEQGLPSSVLQAIIKARQGVEGPAVLPKNFPWAPAQGSDLLNQVPLSNQPPNWQQSIVQELNANRMGPVGATDFWRNGQRFVKGPRGWMMDPHMFMPPIQRKGGQTILPRAEGTLGRYVKREVWDALDSRLKREASPDFIEHARLQLEAITGNQRIADFWLMQHIQQRSLQGKATPAEIVWFELQRGRRPPDEGMAGAKR